MQNKCKNVCGERKKGKLVIPFLYVETMGVNGVNIRVIVIWFLS